MITQGKRRLSRSALALLLFSLAAAAGAVRYDPGVGDAWGPRYHAGPPAQTPESHLGRPRDDAVSRVRHWNEIAIDASGLDNTPAARGETRIFAERFGPGRASRAMAI